jgi:anti-sigma regulatory factor (Ser/Thr protein kinase)
MARAQFDLDDASSAIIPSTQAGLKRGLEWLSRWLKGHDLRTEADDRALLVFEEIVSNIINYGFDDHGEHAIEVNARIEGNDLTFTFEDDGRPFDPRSAPGFARPETLEGAPIGGRGLVLVRQVAQRLDYRRTGRGHNVLTVTLARG